MYTEVVENIAKLKQRERLRFTRLLVIISVAIASMVASRIHHHRVHACARLIGKETNLAQGYLISTHAHTHTRLQDQDAYTHIRTYKSVNTDVT